MAKISFEDLIAPAFHNLHCDIKEELYTHYWLKGGRGSTKSSFISLEIIFGMMKDPSANAMILRKVGLYLRESVFEQLLWAIEALGVSNYWDVRQSPLELRYRPTGQRIVFRGADDPKKIKSTKLKKGYFKFVWFEEVDEFKGMEEIRVILQSVVRSGDKFNVFCSYNPPKSVRNWVNEEVLSHRKDRQVHHSNYLTVPKPWLGEQFFVEADHLKKNKPEIYKHEYLGEVIGTGGEVFENITIKTITDDEIKQFDRIYNGLDWGYYPDPLAFVRCYYNASQKRLFIFDELKLIKSSNENSAKIIEEKGIKRNELIICDSAEPKSIADFRKYGMYAIGASKGPGSVNYSTKWLQSLNEIVIDSERCPSSAKEFLEYEHEKDKEGNVVEGYPDHNNHFIDATRYALNMVWKRRGE